MADRETVCMAHSGCLKDIENLKGQVAKNCQSIVDLHRRLDGFGTRMNVTLGGIAVSCILLLINMFLIKGGLK